MVKINPVFALQITGYDFNVLYNADGTANINYTLFSDSGKGVQGQVKVDKAFTDAWKDSDATIIQAIEADCGLLLQPVNHVANG